MSLSLFWFSLTLKNVKNERHDVMSSQQIFDYKETIDILLGVKKVWNEGGVSHFVSSEKQLVLCCIFVNWFKNWTYFLQIFRAEKRSLLSR